VTPRRGSGEQVYSVTATAPRQPIESRPGLVVEGDALPEWVLRWCGRSGRTVHTSTAPGAGDSVIVLRETAFAEPPRIAVALRRLPDDAAVLADAFDAAVHLDGSLTLIHGVPLSFGERSVGLSDALLRGEEVLLEARALLETAGADVAVDTRLVRAWPHELVGEQLDADLLAVGGPHAAVDDVGLVAATAVRHAPCPVLVVARPTAGRDDPRSNVAWAREPWIPPPRASVELTARPARG
jgi:nucleotide-binding universal stress UspA family protein